jgi:benzoyl-CoA reductase/2-hydroxyglutaryl-CoA dehydratase subunit BcrC/BadD/HgdB
VFTLEIVGYDCHNKTLVKSRGLPALHLERGCSNSDLESLKVRAEAILEMVEI